MSFNCPHICVTVVVYIATLQPDADPRVMLISATVWVICVAGIFIFNQLILWSNNSTT